MEQMKRVPKRRFAGFTDEWEQRKLGDITETYSGGTPSVENKSYYGGNIPFIRSAEINADSTELFITEDGLHHSSAKMVNKGDILYALYGATSGEVGISKIDGAINQAILAMKLKFGDDAYFITKWLEKQKDKIISTYLQGGQGNLSGSIVKALNLKLPSIEEQQKIGSFFKQLDDTIALQQRKLEKTKALKSAYLAEMFPAEGERVPKRRFHEFQDSPAWEERKLEELASFSKGNGYSKKDLTNMGKPIILYGQLYTKYETVIKNVDTFTSKKENSVISKGNEVIVPSSGETSEDISRASVVSKPGIILGGDLNVIRPFNKINSVFLALSISNGNQQKELIKRVQGKSVVHLYNSDLKEVNLFFPRKEEQQKIGQFFIQIDDMITNHQRKLDKLKAMKQAYLHEMFV